jgi:hypothetical protein
LYACLERVEREDQDVDANSGECSGLGGCQFGFVSRNELVRCFMEGNPAAKVYIKLMER